MGLTLEEGRGSFQSHVIIPASQPAKGKVDPSVGLCNMRKRNHCLTLRKEFFQEIADMREFRRGARSPQCIDDVTLVDDLCVKCLVQNAPRRFLLRVSRLVRRVDS